MANQSPSPNPHEYVNEREIQQLEKENRAFLLTNYLGKVATFRSRAFLKLSSHQAIDPEVGWAIFCDDHEKKSTVFSSLGKQTLLIMNPGQHTETNQLRPPNVRIITNELMPSEKGLEIMSQDVTVYPDNDAMYYVSSVAIGSAGISADTLASVFIVKDEKLMLTNWAQDGTIMFSIEGEDTDTLVSPFGDNTILEDKLYALTRAEELLVDVQHLDPTYKNSGV